MSARSFETLCLSGAFAFAGVGVVYATVGPCTVTSLDGSACLQAGGSQTKTCPDIFRINAQLKSVVIMNQGRDSSRFEDLTCVWQARKSVPGGCDDDGPERTWNTSSESADGKACGGNRIDPEADDGDQR